MAGILSTLIKQEFYEVVEILSDLIKVSRIPPENLIHWRFQKLSNNGSFKKMLRFYIQTHRLICILWNKRTFTVSVFYCHHQSANFYHNLCLSPPPPNFTLSLVLLHFRNQFASMHFIQFFLCLQFSNLLPKSTSQFNDSLIWPVWALQRYFCQFPASSASPALPVKVNIPHAITVCRRPPDHNQIARIILKTGSNPLFDSQFTPRKSNNCLCNRIAIKLIKIHDDWHSQACEVYLKLPLEDCIGFCSEKTERINTTRISAQLLSWMVTLC